VPLLADEPPGVVPLQPAPERSGIGGRRWQRGGARRQQQGRQWHWHRQGGQGAVRARAAAPEDRRRPGRVWSPPPPPPRGRGLPAAAVQAASHEPLTPAGLLGSWIAAAPVLRVLMVRHYFARTHRFDDARLLYYC